MAKVNRGCKVPGCTRDHYAHGWCQRHYNMERNGKDPYNDTGKRSWPYNLIERLEEQPNGCIHIIIDRYYGGYARISGPDGIRKPAHVLAYLMFVGPIPEGWEIDHVCHTLDPECPGGECPHRRCVNPAHLEAVPGIENRHRSSTRRTHCKNGHELTGSNTYTRPDGLGQRACRECQRISNRASGKRRREREGRAG